MALPPMIQLPLSVFEKRCSKCRVIKDAQEFCRTKASPVGLSYQCKACHKQNRKTAYEKNPDAYRAQWRNYYKNHREEISVRNAAYRLQVGEQRRARHRAYYKETREVYLERCRHWRAENREAIKQRKARYAESHREERHLYTQNYRMKRRDEQKILHRLWYITHREKRIAQVRDYQRRNIEKVKLWQHHKRSRKRFALGSYSHAEFAALFVSHNGRCYYCGEEHGEHYHRDHKQPLAKNGTNFIDNIAITCVQCNLRKQDKTEDEFRNFLCKQDTTPKRACSPS